ncbi:MAG: bL21 family ribosomal protein [Bacteroidota bacterium]|nr:bL21 family ribosomal protein [Bacteroidota bacterium]
MKLLLAVLLFFFFNNAYGQKTQNSIEDAHIHIKNRLNRTYSLGSARQLQKAFGNANITKEIDEVLGGYAYTYVYNGFETYFNEHNWEATIIKSADYTIILNGTPYKVGEQISKFKDHFSISYKYKKKRSRNYNGLWISIVHRQQYTDAYIFVAFNDNGYITEVTITNDNS